MGRGAYKEVQANPLGVAAVWVKRVGLLLDPTGALPRIPFCRLRFALRPVWMCTPLLGLPTDSVS